LTRENNAFLGVLKIHCVSCDSDMEYRHYEKCVMALIVGICGSRARTDAREYATSIPWGVSTFRSGMCV